MYILYCSLLLPYLTYCVEMWGNTNLININGIFLLQKRVIPIRMVPSVWIIRIHFFFISRYYRTKNVIIYVQSILSLFAIKHSEFIC